MLYVCEVVWIYFVLCVFNLVINMLCLRVFVEEIWWEKVVFGKIVEEKCLFGFLGL